MGGEGETGQGVESLALLDSVDRWPRLNWGKEHREKCAAVDESTGKGSTTDVPHALSCTAPGDTRAEAVFLLSVALVKETKGVAKLR